MKFYLISDNIDTQMGMRLAGIEGIVVHEREEVIKAVEEATAREDVGVLLVTTKLMRLCSDYINEIQLTRKKPLIAEVPDRHSCDQIGQSIDRYVSEAIGIQI